MQIHLQQQVPASQTASICHLPHPPRRRAVSKQREASQSRLRALAGSAAPVSGEHKKQTTRDLQLLLSVIHLGSHNLGICAGPLHSSLAPVYSVSQAHAADHLC